MEYRVGGDEFVIILSGRDYIIRKELVLALHDRSVEHINTGGVVVSGGYSDYKPGEDPDFHRVFIRADELMYEEKQLLKGLGSVTREDAEEASAPAGPTINGQERLFLSNGVSFATDHHIYPASAGCFHVLLRKLRSLWICTYGVLSFCQ